MNITHIQSTAPARSFHRLLNPVRKAFTLMEMMLVLAIIALLIAIGAVALQNVQGGAEITAAEAHMNTIKVAITQYKTLNRTLPGKLEDLVKPPANARVKKSLLKDSGIKDPWQNIYQYRSPGKTNGQPYEVFSMGPDGKAGTEDDVYSD
ncbi:type II secretion system protein GspG [Prosthecobacter sp. SYSU 5D2]|uniref:type II secretion system protein GspG n=1 Tax=Prosthecobacter sp. SYSU 5D2 TaxID=3134134 RepID=UPI0031FE5891